jgi:hypothetical protein
MSELAKYDPQEFTSYDVGDCNDLDDRLASSEIDLNRVKDWVIDEANNVIYRQKFSLTPSGFTLEGSVC